MIKVFCSGSEGYLNQIDRIRHGFLSNSCELSSLEDADIIYFNDPNSYDLDSKYKNPKAKVIFNVLDIPPHCIDENRYDISRYPYIHNPIRDFNIDNLKEKLSRCDIITCICDEVKWQLKNWCGIEAVTIYNPVKDVSFLNLNQEQKIKNKLGKNYKYLYVGRANDPNKRFQIVYDTMKILGNKSSDLAVVGSENPRWGDYYGVLDDHDLNLFYNSVEYFFFPSAFKSIGLPALESVITKTKTIVCDDDPTTREFWSEIELSSNPLEISKSILSEEWNNKCLLFNDKMHIIYKDKFNKKTIAKNIINLL